MSKWDLYQNSKVILQLKINPCNSHLKKRENKNNMIILSRGTEKTGKI